MTKDEALKALIHEMEYVLSCINKGKIPFDGDDFHEALRLGKKALAQPEQEPFAYVNIEKRRLEFAHDYVKWDTPTTIKLDKIPLYTTPPQRTWQGLTDEDWDEIFGNALTIGEAIKVTEAKLKQKNGYKENT